MLKTFIDRPVLSTVISIVVVVLGVIGLVSLPVEQYPDVAPPTVNVSVVYPGANAEVLLNSTIIPLEEQINGVEGMTYMESTAMNNGMGFIKIYFNQNVNPDIAAVNVQNLAARANPLLPSEVVQQGVTVKKQQNSTILAFTLSTTSDVYDGEFLQNYANINILPQIKRVNGVGNAEINGAKDYSMRIWMKPDVMASYRVSVSEVLAALKDQSIEAAPGELGANSNQSFQYTLKYRGKYQTEEEFQDIIIRSQNGHILRLKDVADVELGSISYAVLSTLNGTEESIFCSISQVAGSNAQQVIEDVKAVLNDAQKIMPEGIQINYMMDSSEFLEASIQKVLSTLLEAFILVFIVVYIFLQDIRSTIIPAIAIPVSIVGTFFFMWVLGFSVNLITLFALILAIGIVVDDAIVVVEAVKAQLEAGAKSAREATLIAMKEIAPAIIAITLVMSAVFFPVSFLAGTTGVFFKQFGLTLAFSILISALNALTLSPALCALFLKPETEHEEGGKRSFIDRFFYSFNVMFNAATSKYKGTLHFLAKGWNKVIAIIIIAVMVLLFAQLSKITPSDFVPNEDSGSVVGLITLAPGTSLEESDKVAQEVIKIAGEIEGIKNFTNISGVNIMAGLGSSYATFFIKMEHWHDRKITTDEVAAQLTEKTAHIKNATFMFQAMPTLQGFGITSGVTFSLQDRLGGDVDKFYQKMLEFNDALRASGKTMIVHSDFNNKFPQYEITADIPKIKEAGLTLGEIMLTMQTYIGSNYVNTFNLYGKQFKIMAQASPEYRTKVEDLDGIYVKTASGEMAPITEFISLKRTTGSPTLTRLNMYNSMDVMVIPDLMNGYNTGDIYPLIEELAPKILGNDYTYEYTGLSREGSGGSSQMIIIFGICFLFIYLLLSALYESYIIPFAVLLSVPIGLAGVFIAIWTIVLLGGPFVSFNIYVQISMIMLIGLLAKNAILIVEYAIQRRQQGMSIIDAAINGAVARLRPILMTSFAFIAGVTPLALATGAGAVGNRSLGVATIGGMVVGTMIGVIVIPTLYIIFQYLQEKISGPNLINEPSEK